MTARIAAADFEGIKGINEWVLNDQSEYNPPEFSAPEPPIMGFQYHIGPFNVYPNSELSIVPVTVFIVVIITSLNHLCLIK